MRPALLLLSLAALACAQEPADLVILTGTVIPSPGERQDGAAIVVRGGRIESVVPRGKAPEAKAVREFKDAVAFPGLVDACTGLGVGDQGGIQAIADVSGIRILDSFDPGRREMGLARATGLTLFGIAPNRSRCLGGLGGIGGWKSDGSAAILDPARIVQVSLEEEQYDRGIPPTTAEGALPSIRAAMAAVPDSRVVFVRFSSPRQRELAEALCALAPGRVVFVAPPAAFPDGRLGAQPRGIVLVGVSFSLAPREKDAVRALARTEVPLAVTSLAPERGAGWQRVAASALREITGSAKAAEAAITTGGAFLLDAGKETGTLVPGQRADITIWSHEPTDLRSRLLGVLAEGSWIHESKDGESSP